MTPEWPALVAFDLDDTLAPSKSPLPAPMAKALTRLLATTPVAVISGATFDQFARQVVRPLSALPGRRLDRLWILATCGTQCFRYIDGRWRAVFSELLDERERRAAMSALESSAKRLELWPDRSHGDVLEDRRSQVTFSALGQDAPLALKLVWDPDGTKKERLRDEVTPLVPDLEVRIGGTTSIDITRRGRDKAFGMRRLMAETGIAPDDILFFGDRLEPGGNDHPVLSTGVRCASVRGWEDTLGRIGDLDGRSGGRLPEVRDR
ncbi:HAD-IIB family hydrolase [Humibacter ginsenosidimutans]|uniref:phosphomannomutase n=1 Tax=Humibacter ginsenosidimutans TaxID=2599293 RepID=A0A5B8M8Y0_9MICO|nr:HAD-IIB family hydrolase [Humibacter ginsenosidimutans]QDZ16045.1 HAD-IIB family hydrolase [Humibacter ginsenosidimutans]